jgi:hypothetical protein
VFTAQFFNFLLLPDTDHYHKLSLLNQNSVGGLAMRTLMRRRSHRKTKMRIIKKL